MAARSRVDIELNLQDRGVKRGLDEAKRSADELDESLDDAATAGEKTARALEQLAANAKDDLDGVRRAADALEVALDGALDIDTVQAVGELRDLGLTTADIEADAESLARALRSVDDVKVHAASQGFGDLGNSVTQVGHNSERANDATRGFLGNVAGDSVDAMTGVSGLGESISQLTEGLLEGDVNAAQLGKSLAMMAGVAGAVALVSAAVSSIAETKAFNEKQVQDWADAIREAGGHLDGVMAQIRDSEELLGRSGGFWGMFEDEHDIVPTLVSAGITISDVNRAVREGDMSPLIADLEALAKQADEAALSNLSNREATAAAQQQAQTYRDAIDILGDTLENVTAAQEAAAIRTAFLGTAQEQLAVEMEKVARMGAEHVGALLGQEAQSRQTEAAVDDFTDATDDSTEALRKSEEALRDEADALSENAGELHDQISARRDWADQTLKVEQAEADLVTQLAASGKELDKHEQGSAEYEAALRKVVTAAQDLADKQVDLKNDTAAAEGATRTAAQQLDTYNRSMLTSAATTNGVMRQAILDHIARVNGIPTDVMTDIGAAIDRGDIDLANRMLDDVSSTRSAAIRADAYTYDANRKLDWAARNRSTNIHVTTSGADPRYWGYRAQGTQGSSGGLTMVGEQGAELVELPTGSKVRSRGETNYLLEQALAGSMNRGGDTFNVTVIAPPGSHPNDTARALNNYRRIQGET